MRINAVRRSTTAVVALTAAVALTACSADTSTTSDAATTSDGATAEPGPRVVVSYAGGLRVLDAETLADVADFTSEDYTRLNAAGDGRHVMVTTSAGFQVLDTAAGTADTPELTDTVFPARSRATWSTTPGAPCSTPTAPATPPSSTPPLWVRPTACPRRRPSPARRLITASPWSCPTALC
ncbi:hypothetical protein [Rhodococcus sp. PBTS 1]|uniref:hypothetical protein n=1 Tax=Rhodococcus sp. PBTS 1 TaxID=1653478 RepID=UPI000A409267|nr:hypothetical protein [Rhodococcus sp. PBTS 1]